MLETEEVDADYFTPGESTTLASIFGKGSQADETKDNSLKYVPPPPPSAKPEEIKPTQWIFTCAVHGFEWTTSGYISRGKLGLAILKVLKTNNHSIILYNSNKATVSFVAITTKLKIHKRDALTIAYYDNAQKYWSIQTSDDDMNKILQLLQNLQVTVIHKSFQETDREQSDNNRVDSKDNIAVGDEGHKEEKELDTDSYVNQKTKDSILKRMANMGHSVLPPHGVTKAQTSDSSDSDDIDGSKKNVRHKPVKGSSKKSIDLNMPEAETTNTSLSRKVHSHKSNNDGQSLAPTKIINTGYSGDANIFLSEQRICNSELRINMTRISDKIDLILERICDYTNTNKSNSQSNFQNDVIQKLLKEYESKICRYDDLITSKDVGENSVKSSSVSHMWENTNENSQDIEAYKNQVEELKKDCIEKDSIIAIMKNDIQMFNETYNKMIEDKNRTSDDLQQKFETVSDELKLKSEEVLKLKNKLENTSTTNQEGCDIANRVKKIMNDTYQAISVNFNDEDTYTGEALKGIIAAVIKKTTMEALK